MERRLEPDCRFVRSEPENDLANAFAESFPGSDPDSLRDPRLLSLLTILAKSPYQLIRAGPSVSHFVLPAAVHRAATLAAWLFHPRRGPPDSDLL